MAKRKMGSNIDTDNCWSIALGRVEPCLSCKVTVGSRWPRCGLGCCQRMSTGVGSRGSDCKACSWKKRPFCQYPSASVFASLILYILCFWSGAWIRTHPLSLASKPAKEKTMQMPGYCSFASHALTGSSCLWWRVHRPQHFIPQQAGCQSPRWNRPNLPHKCGAGQGSLIEPLPYLEESTSIERERENQGAILQWGQEKRELFRVF